MAEGVVAVTSNGNSGPENWTVGSPGTSRDAISVGASQLPYNEYSVTLIVNHGSDSAGVFGIFSLINKWYDASLDNRNFSFHIFA